MDTITIKAPDEHATMMLTRWHVANGSEVAANTALCEVEIAWVYEREFSEDVIQLTSPISGVVNQIATVGDVLAAGQDICRVESLDPMINPPAPKSP